MAQRPLRKSSGLLASPLGAPGVFTNTERRFTANAIDLG
jgi:hypothetical protein